MRIGRPRLGLESLGSIPQSFLQRLPLSPQRHHKSGRFEGCRSKRSPAMTRILIADDSLPVRCGLRFLLGLNSDWQVCGEAVGGADAVAKAHQLAPDLILMNLSMPQMDGVQAAREIAKSARPSRSCSLLRFFRLRLSNPLATLVCAVRFQSPKSASCRLPSKRSNAARLSSWRAWSSSRAEHE